MDSVTLEPGAQGTRSQRWLARLSFVLAAAAVVIAVVFAGLRSISMLAVALAGAAVGLAAAYFFLSRRGLWRWLSLGVFVLAPIAVLVVFARPESAVGGARVGRRVAAGQHDRAPGADREDRPTGGCPSTRQSHRPRART